jgi:hypothetical protein
VFKRANEGSVQVSKVTLVVGAIALVAGTVFVQAHTSGHPVKLLYCDNLYKNCRAYARFRTIDDCKTTEERMSWYCDIVTDKQNPRCEARASPISASYCSD